ncbi:MAG: T9SS type A sorting domain-containing protein [Muribaculaceae bacterium]|nr:T9SS type A sorting domain-containing protein [Muribaculaceae bacterium]
MKRIYTKICCLALGMLFAVGVASAEKAVVVITADGTQRGVMLDDVDRIELGSDALTVQTASGTSETVQYSEINRVLIGSEWQSVKQLTAPGEIAVWPVTTNDLVNVSGLSDGEIVRVYALDGALALQVDAVSGLTTVSLAQLPAGIYVLTAHNQSVKIVKN